MTVRNTVSSEILSGHWRTIYESVRPGRYPTSPAANAIRSDIRPIRPQSAARMWSVLLYVPAVNLRLIFRLNSSINHDLSLRDQ